MANTETPRYLVQDYGTSFVVRDTKLDQDVTAPTTRADAQAKADAKNQLDAFGIQAGDTVTGTLTSNRGRIKITVDREPWTSGTRNVILSDGRSVEAVQLEGLEVTKAGTPGSCWCASLTCTGQCPDCGMHETQTHGHNVHYDTDPEAHSTDLDGGHLNRTIQPGDTGESCRICSSDYATGDWRLLLPDARIRGKQLHMCRPCAEAIGVAVAEFPATPAPWVHYS